MARSKETCGDTDVSERTNLLHPTSGGAEAISANIQVSRQQATAWSGLKMKLPRGLQMTSHLSKAITAKDHRQTIPGEVFATLSDNTLQRRIRTLTHVCVCAFRCMCMYMNVHT